MTGSNRHDVALRMAMALGIAALAVELRHLYVQFTISHLLLATNFIQIGALLALVLALFTRRHDRACRDSAEAAQRSTEERHDAIVNSVADAIISVDEHQRIVSFNCSAERAFGVPSCTAVGQPLDNFIPGCLERQQRHASPCSHRADEPQPCPSAPACLCGRRASGEEFPIEAACTHLTVNGHREIVVVVRDVAERVRTEQELQLVRHRLAHVARVTTMGKMAAALSHELTQPLTAITLYAQGLEQSFADDTLPDHQMRREALRRIAAQSLRAGEVIGRLQNMIKERVPELRIVDCRALIDDVVALAEPDARLLQAEIHAATVPRGVAVLGDAVELQQVLINLIRNALEAVGGQPKHSRIVSIQVAVTEDAVELSVVDHGPGLPPDLADSVLKNDFVTTKPDGMGLGLAISRSILEAHLGRITHSTTPGGGATFSVSLPRLPVEAAE